mmetsp:Transcript_16121/g.23325  ORF Transcript_16121/g.23325 Transcript_16121/m.23325 type:complete len:119 (-) Transcript_16121:871-1227(-)
MEPQTVRKSIAIWVLLGSLVFLSVCIYGASRDSQYWEPLAPKVEPDPVLASTEELIKHVKQLHRIHSYLYKNAVLSSSSVKNTTEFLQNQNNYKELEKDTSQKLFSIDNNFARLKLNS